MQCLIHNKIIKLTLVSFVISMPQISFAYEDSDFSEPTSVYDATAVNPHKKPKAKNFHKNSKKHKLQKKVKQTKFLSLQERPEKTNFKGNDPYYGKHLCSSSEYKCLPITRGDSWTSLFPDERERELVQRLNRTNQGLWNRSWILIPRDLKKDYMTYAPLPAQNNYNNKKTIIVSYKEQAFGAYDETGKLVHWGPVSPGKPGTRTAIGENFQVYRKGGANCWSKKFEATIPYCMFFHGGFALHGFTMPGYPASHGCVRMYNEDAKWLNKEFADYKTRVIVR